MARTLQECGNSIVLAQQTSMATASSTLSANHRRRSHPLASSPLVSSPSPRRPRHLLSSLSPLVAPRLRFPHPQFSPWRGVLITFARQPGAATISRPAPRKTRPCDAARAGEFASACMGLTSGLRAVRPNPSIIAVVAVVVVNNRRRKKR